ncbi:MAG: hypothetical protein LIP77_04065, partial [Planctomycetes bacterium]|nr:hypothetical protein [Planctomycetota bacterium]
MSSSPIDLTGGLQAGQTRHGFRIERSVPLEAMRLHALVCRHPRSGARLLHLAADDPENLFSVAFRTPPPDNTGLPHILEHT